MNFANSILVLLLFSLHFSFSIGVEDTPRVGKDYVSHKLPFYNCHQISRPAGAICIFWKNHHVNKEIVSTRTIIVA